ncbi:isochorismatase family protein [Fimbriiglobus ruber]|uniref:Isochorismatase n=1 Tax=Fimbriiglobus ruber TaxID=1908690 RepID=A0A225E8G5_9BACT|nr:isochorismatase family protein [Fimbriiglobus ruber]OWK46376.1 Isochorismatase [Fimbriiglobus ruber]
MPTLIPRLTAADTILVVVDVQDKLLAKMPTAGVLVRNVEFLLDAANLLAVPAVGTEQYPKGLGPTAAGIAARLPGGFLAKTAFSCCGAAGFLADLRGRERPNVVLAGMEAHVCVAHTALDLLEAGFRVFLPVDAIASRAALDADTAVRRLERAGAVPTTAEAVVFEWVGDAAHPQFKAISKLIVGRATPGSD